MLATHRHAHLQYVPEYPLREKYEISSWSPHRLPPCNILLLLQACRPSLVVCSLRKSHSSPGAIRHALPHDDAYRSRCLSCICGEGGGSLATGFLGEDVKLLLLLRNVYDGPSARVLVVSYAFTLFRLISFVVRR